MVCTTPALSILGTDYALNNQFQPPESNFFSYYTVFKRADRSIRWLLGQGVKVTTHPRRDYERMALHPPPPMTFTKFYES